MSRQEVLDFLLTNGCVLVRDDNQGYSVIRNVQTGKMSGLPVNDPPRPATVCRICKNLGIDDLPKDEAIQKVRKVVDLVHNKHSQQ